MLVVLKVLYFLNGFSGASFGRFSTLFYLSRGLDATAIGYIGTACLIVAAIGNQLFGFITDYLQRKKLVSLVTRVISTLFITSFLLPQVGHSFKAILLIMASSSFFQVGGGVLDAYTFDLLEQASRPASEYGQYRLWLAISWGVGNVAMGVVAQHNFE